MRCSKCGSDNRQGRKFCSGCGAPLIISCPQCGAPNQPGEGFCGECGTVLDAPAALAANPPVTTFADGERRHLTVLFCDLVGSTEIAARLDPEEWRDMIAAYHRAAAEAITQFGGYVAQYLGDGVMAYFGWPEAHDNNAERAARAGLSILDAISKLNEQATRPKLSARIGIHSGAVVVGAGAGQDADVFGDAPNIAARVQETAAPGTVVVSDDTHRLVSGLFVVEALGAPALKGIERPVRLYRVRQLSGVRGRLQAAAVARGLTPFVGREDELRLLINRWDRVLDGEGQVALIVGEAGIGKSRLVQRFHEQIAGTPHTWVEAAAGPFFQNTPFYPVAELLRELWRGKESPEEQLALLESRLQRAGLNAAEALPLIAPLLDLPLPPAKYPSSPLPPEQRRRRLLASLVELALGTTRVQPTVIVIEDLHWADPSTLDLIQLLVEQGATARLLLLYTARPEFRVRWPLRAHYTQLTLNRLDSHNVRTMVEQVAGHKALPEDTVAAVVERTGGVPLFVEELTRAVIESGDTKLIGRKIPVTLRDSLMARLDRLGPAKEVIQVGAVIGSAFSYPLLHAVHPIADEDLQRALHLLSDADLLYVRGIPPDATYLFKHALIRDTAYEALLKSRRKDLHRVVARAIDEQFTTLKDADPEVLARHWTEAGEIEPAIAQWASAGQAAEARNAFKEALESYHQAVALLTQLPESPERDSREMELRQSVVKMLNVTRGYSATETLAAIERFGALAEKSGKVQQLTNWATSSSTAANWAASRSTIALVSGDLAAGGALADQALELALGAGDLSNVAGAHVNQIVARHWRGDLDGAEKYFTAGLKFFEDPGLKRTPGGPILTALGIASSNAWMLGQTEVARGREAQMMAATNVNNPYEVAWSGVLAARLHLDLREYEQAEALAAQAIELSEKHKFAYPAALSRVALGQARAQLGRATEGVTMIRDGIAGLLEAGARLGICAFSTYLASAQEREGAIVDALATVERALRANATNLHTVPRPSGCAGNCG